MKRVIPWAVAVVALIAFGAAFSELQRVRVRFGEVTRHKFHDHQDVREFMIRAALDGLDHPVVILGDSITEMARFPETVGDRPVVNAGIGGATILDFKTLAPALLEGSKPSLIVVALGVNDARSLTVRQDYVALISVLKTISPNLVAVAVPSVEDADALNTAIRAAAGGESVHVVETSLPEGSMLSDHVHLTRAASVVWAGLLITAIKSSESSGLGE